MVQTDTETWKVFSFLPSLCFLHTVTSDATKWKYTVGLAASICTWFVQRFVKNQTCGWIYEMFRQIYDAHTDPG